MEADCSAIDTLRAAVDSPPFMSGTKLEDPEPAFTQARGRAPTGDQVSAVSGLFLHNASRYRTPDTAPNLLSSELPGHKSAALLNLATSPQRHRTSLNPGKGPRCSRCHRLIAVAIRENLSR